MPSAQRSGLSATIGLVLVVGLLLVAGTLAVSGGGILSTGGRLGVDPVASPSPTPISDSSGVDGDLTTTPSGEGETEETPSTEGGISTKIDFTCDAGAIKELGRRKWFMSQFKAGSRVEEGYDQVTFELSREGSAKAKKAALVRLDWMEPSAARAKYGAPSRIQGSRALVLTFDGPIDVPANQIVDSLQLEREDVNQIKNIQMFEGTDGNVHAIAGLRSDSCARLEGKSWGKKAKGNKSKVLLQVERF